MKLRPPIKIHGGKYYLAARIVAMMPEHKTYLEPYGGAASVLLNKPIAPVEVYNDLDGRLTRLFRIIRDNGDELRRRLALTPYSEVEFITAQKGPGGVIDDIEAARIDYVIWRMSLGGRGDAFSYTKHRIRRCMPDVVSGYLSAIDDEMPKIIDRLRCVQIMCRPAVEVIKAWDSPDTFIYLDPPYVHSTRVAGQYAFEMTDDEHTELYNTLEICASKAMISGYRCDLYDKLYKDWNLTEWDMAAHAAGGKAKNRRIECVWKNY